MPDGNGLIVSLLNDGVVELGHHLLGIDQSGIFGVQDHLVGRFVLIHQVVGVWSDSLPLALGIGQLARRTLEPERSLTRSVCAHIFLFLD